MSFDDIITTILRREGWDKFTDHPADRGGPTKWGITEKAWGGDVRNITEAQARNFYQLNYIHRPGFDRIQSKLVRELAIDAGVNHGPPAVVRWLQTAVGTTPDGALGPITAAAINKADPIEVSLKLIRARLRLYANLATRDHTQRVFLAGWVNRAVEQLSEVIDSMDSVARPG